MKRGSAWFLVVVFGLVLIFGVAALYRLRVARGDVFPPYSSLRADPLGTRALHDAAGLLPGRETLRWTRPLPRLDAGAGDVVFVAGLRSRNLTDEDWLALDQLAIRGARVVVAWRAQASRPGETERVRAIRETGWKKTEIEDPIEVEESEDVEESDEEVEEEERVRVAVKLLPVYASEHELRWGFRLLRRDLVVKVDADDAVLDATAPAGWPESLPRWRSDLFFLPRDDAGWNVWYRRGAEPVLMERRRGAGSVVLMADSFVLSNEAVQRERATPVLVALLEGAARSVFVESHLGVTTETGVAVLARRYGLTGAAGAALLFAALWIWRRASPLAPIPPEDDEVRLVLAPTAGLEALLRRAVAPAKLFAACLDAWRAGASPGDLRRLQGATPPADGDPVAAYNATTRALSHRKLS
jgi:hypothetical protein